MYLSFLERAVVARQLRLVPPARSAIAISVPIATKTMKKNDEVRTGGMGKPFVLFPIKPYRL